MPRKKSTNVTDTLVLAYRMPRLYIINYDIKCRMERNAKEGRQG